jgi:hypothetical protein
LYWLPWIGSSAQCCEKGSTWGKQQQAAICAWTIEISAVKRAISEAKAATIFAATRAIPEAKAAAISAWQMMVSEV